MTEFACNEMSDSTVMLVFLEKDRIFLNPPYQRTSEVWNLYKKQLLIDSLINGFDIPKLYFHEYDRAEVHDKRLCKYAIVDGKQRLSAIWDFMMGKFPLNDDIEYLRESKIKLGGLMYDDLSREHPTIQARFTGRSLSIVTIRTHDTDLIEDMFSRLNEAVPLNAPEKRNARGGPIPRIIRKLVEGPFFKKKISISEKRYRHHDLACKFLFLEEQGKISETKKSRLDSFVINFAKKSLNKKAQELADKTERILRSMVPFFDNRDSLLKSPGIVVIYYLLFREDTLSAPRSCGIDRRVLLEFEKHLANNRKLAENDLPAADFRLLEFDRLSQAPNDSSAIEFRVKVLRDYLAAKGQKAAKPRRRVKQSVVKRT